jgi:hypothetical protein
MRQILETAFRQRGLPLSCAVESEGYDLKFALIADGVGLGCHATTSPYIVNAQEPEDRQSKGFRTEDERLASAFETSWPPRSGRPVSPGLCSKEPQNKERR